MMQKGGVEKPKMVQKVAPGLQKQQTITIEPSKIKIYNLEKVMQEVDN